MGRDLELFFKKEADIEACSGSSDNCGIDSLAQKNQ